MKLKTEYFYSPAQKRCYNKWLFSLIASEYSTISKMLSFGMDHYWKNELIKCLPAIDAPITLDCACGTGDISILLASRLRTAKIIGIDLSRKMLDILKCRLKSDDRISAVMADVCNIPLCKNSCDVVTGGYALRNAPDLKEFLLSVFSVLKPGGLAVFLDFSKYQNRTLQKIEYILLSIWGGFWGILTHRNPQIYGYIAESLKVFPSVKMLEDILRSIGFEEVVTKRYLLGMIAIVVLKKPMKLQ